MAAKALIGSAFLTATVEDLLLRLSSPDFIDYITSSKLNLLKLTVFETSLLTLHSVLPDAERKHFFNPSVEQWMDELYDAISLADDLIDEIGYDSMQCKVHNTQPDHHFFFNFRLNLINVRLQRFVQRIPITGLQSVSCRVSCRISSSSVLNESFIVGREDDKEKLMNMLLSSDSGTNLGVIALLGVGGVGKTTLAELVYNDKQVHEHFDLKMWIRFSEGFDIVRVIITLLASVCSLLYNEKNLDYLRLVLKQKLKSRRFLFVFDDLWNVGYNDWNELVAPLVDGNLGSRVIITTRQEKVAEVVHTFQIHKLEPLSYEDCWSLLSKHAFGSKDYDGDEYPDLEAICRKISRKCRGLPLAAKTLGGLLSSNVDLKRWISILISNIWNIPDNNILPSLLLSYQYLPSYLKRCFAYCSVFPKGYSFDRKQLILLWMAEGFLEHSQGEKAPEEVGDDYFVELLSRSFIQQLKDDTERKKFVLHDLLYDLAEIVSGKSCCKLECGGIISKKVQHLSYIPDKYGTFKKFEIFYDFKSLRSFLPICIRRGSNYLSRKVVDDLLPTLRSLRVLSLSHHSNFTVLPDSIYNLLHLRYLDLSHTDIKSLPESICDLYYLQTLNLSSCFSLNELPVDIGKLINLRHLDISDSRIKKMPMQIVRLENLQTLSVFIVGNQEVGLSVRELGKFPNIRGKLYIGNLCNVINVNEACDANLKNKELIDELELIWGEEEEGTNDSQTDKVVLDGLQPSINLKKLRIANNPPQGVRFRLVPGNEASKPNTPQSAPSHQPLPQPRMRVVRPMVVRPQTVYVRGEMPFSQPLQSVQPRRFVAPMIRQVRTLRPPQGGIEENKRKLVTILKSFLTKCSTTPGANLSQMILITEQYLKGVVSTSDYMSALRQNVTGVKDTLVSFLELYINAVRKDIKEKRLSIEECVPFKVIKPETPQQQQQGYNTSSPMNIENAPSPQFHQQHSIKNEPMSVSPSPMQQQQQQQRQVPSPFVPINSSGYHSTKLEPGSSRSSPIMRASSPLVINRPHGSVGTIERSSPLTLVRDVNVPRSSPLATTSTSSTSDKLMFTGQRKETPPTTTYIYSDPHQVEASLPQESANIPHPPLQQQQQVQQIHLPQQPQKVLVHQLQSAPPPQQPVIPEPTPEPEPAEPIPDDIPLSELPHEVALQRSLIDPNSFSALMQKKFPGMTVEAPAFLAISEYLETRLRQLITTARQAAEHRSEQLRNNANYMEAENPREQLAALERVEKVQKQQKMEREKEKSSSKSNGKSDASKIKELTSAKQKEELNRDANEAAIAAITGKKRQFKTDGKDGPAAKNKKIVQPRGKQITMKDLIFAFERDTFANDSMLCRKALYGLYNEK